MDRDNRIKIDIDNKTINVKFVVISQDEGNVVSSYMPGFDIYYSSPDMDTAIARGEAMVHNFFNFWIEKQSWKKFIAKIHALGFRASKLHNLKVKNLLNNRPEKAGFSPNTILEGKDIFQGEFDERESNLELAI